MISTDDENANKIKSDKSLCIVSIFIKLIEFDYSCSHRCLILSQLFYGLKQTEKVN